MADQDERAEHDALIVEMGEDIDYWYQVAQSLAAELVHHHMPYDRVAAIVRAVENDAACDFERLNRHGSVSSFVCLRMFEGLRTIRSEKRAASDGKAER